MKYKSQRKLPKAVKPEEFKLLIKKIPEKDKVARISFLLAYGSGLRISEVCKLKKDNVGERMIEIWEAKGGVDRKVPLPKGWKNWMVNHLPVNRSDRTLERKFNKYSKMAGLPEYYVFHSLRHGFATRAIESGVPLSHIQMLMGHSSIATTNVYTRARPEDALKSYEELF